MYNTGYHEHAFCSANSCCPIRHLSDHRLRKEITPKATPRNRATEMIPDASISTTAQPLDLRCSISRFASQYQLRINLDSWRWCRYIEFVDGLDKTQ